MSARTITCVVLECDGCGNPIEAVTEGIQIHFESHDNDVAEAKAKAREWLRDHDGSSDGERDWCDRCTFAGQGAPDPAVTA